MNLGKLLDAAHRSFDIDTSPCESLFKQAQPEGGGVDFLTNLNADSLKVMTAYVEPSLASGGAIEAKADDKFQFERHRCFVADQVDHAAGKPVFNLAMRLKDSWEKVDF